MKRGLLLLLVLVIGMGTLGCSGGISGDGEEAEQKTEVSKELQLPMTRVRTLNPISGMDEDCYHISKLLYQGLFALDENSVPQPQIAESAYYSEDGLKIIVTLKDGIKWSDGSTITASDVKFSYDAHLNRVHSGASIYSSYLQCLKWVKVRESDQIEFAFTTKEACVLENLTVPIVPEDQFGSLSKAVQVEEDFVPIGSGPYRATSVDMYREVVLEPNPNFAGTAATNTVTFVILPEKKNALNLFSVGEVDYMVLTGADRDTQLSNVDAKEVPFLSNEAEYIGFNCKRPIPANRNVRAAIAFAVDRSTILSYAYYGNGQLNDTLYYPNYLGVKSDTDPYAFDVQNAKKKLKQAGYSDVNRDGYLEDAEGKTLELELLVNSDNPSRLQAAIIISEGLNDAGIRVTTSELSWEAYQSALNTGKYDLYIGGTNFRDCSQVRDYLYSGNRIGYENADVVEKLDQMLGRSESDKEGVFQKLHDTLVKNLPYYCLLFKTYGAIVPEGLKGTVGASYSNYYKGVETFSVERILPGSEEKTVETVDSEGAGE